MEQAWSTKFEQIPVLSRSGLCINSQLYLRNKNVAFLDSSSKISRRNCVKSIDTFQALTWKGKSRKCVPKALMNSVYDAYKNEAEVTKNGTVADTMDIVNTAVIKEGGDMPEKGSKKEDHVEKNGVQPLKWPLWLLAPSMLLATGVIPTLWLPFSSILSGCNVASLLSLTGLDGIFNIGATFFLLMADNCARSKKGKVSYFKIPFSYKFWNFLLNLVGFVIPCLAWAASYSGLIQPNVCLLSFATMLGPYLMLLSVQMLAEMLMWHWKSPVWLIVPVVYEAYRFLQLIRGLDLGIDLGAPTWLMEGMKGLVAWWVLVFGMQLMRIAWFVGSGQTRQEA